MCTSRLTSDVWLRERQHTMLVVKSGARVCVCEVDDQSFPSADVRVHSRYNTPAFDRTQSFRQNKVRALG